MDSYYTVLLCVLQYYLRFSINNMFTIRHLNVFNHCVTSIKPYILVRRFEFPLLLSIIFLHWEGEGSRSVIMTVFVMISRIFRGNNSTLLAVLTNGPV